MSATIKPEPAGTPRADAGLIGKKNIYRLKTRAFELMPVYAWEEMDVGQNVQGPALIVSYGTTVPLHDDQSLTIDAYRNLIIEFPELGS